MEGVKDIESSDSWNCDDLEIYDGAFTRGKLEGLKIAIDEVLKIEDREKLKL